jgi:hypothetical protein
MNYKTLVLITGEYFEVDDIIKMNYKHLPEGTITAIERTSSFYRVKVENDDKLKELHIPYHSVRFTGLLIGTSSDEE